MRNLLRVSYCLPKWFRNHTIFSPLYQTILIGNMKPLKGFVPNFNYLKLFVIGSGYFFEFFLVVCTEPKMVPRIETSSKPFQVPYYVRKLLFVRNTSSASTLHHFVSVYEVSFGKTNIRIEIALIELTRTADIRDVFTL